MLDDGLEQDRPPDVPPRPGVRPHAKPRGRGQGAAPPVCSHSPSRKGPPGAGNRPANTSASSRCRHVSSETTAAEVSSIRSSRSASGWSSTTTRAGSPAATSMDVTVKPARSTNAPAVQSDTAPPIRPRKRRIGSRSASSGSKGWLEWIVTRPPRRASAVIERHRAGLDHVGVHARALLGLVTARVHSPRRTTEPTREASTSGRRRGRCWPWDGSRRTPPPRRCGPRASSPVALGTRRVISTASSSWAGESESG